MNDIFKDLTDGISSLGEVEHFNYKYKQYNLVYFDSPPWGDEKQEVLDNNNNRKKSWYIMGTDRVFEKEVTEILKTNDQFTFSTSINNSDIFISLFNLASLIEKDKNSFTDELLFSEEIIQWCSKFGLPYSEDYFVRNYSKKNNNIPYINLGGFRIKEFKRQITLLHDYFHLWYGLTFNDVKKIIEYSKRAQGIDINKDINKQIIKLKKRLSEILRMYTTQIHINFYYNNQKDIYEIKPYSDNLVSIAYFQFAILMTNNGTNSADFCSMCGILYQKEHGNQKHCSKCKEDYHRIKMQESRKRKKRKETN